MNRIDPAEKYQPFAPISLPDRTWPSRTITQAPFWCAVDLRDGNQALVEPMGSPRKLRLFQLLVDMGYKEIEVGFPAASRTDFDFLRLLVDGNHIPDDVTIQVLTQAREELIARTYEALKGVRRSVVHLYNSTSTLQRDVVFRMDRQGITDLARHGATWVREQAEKADGEIVYQYSPESFTGTELDYAVEVCEAVMEVYEPTPERRVILNLPATVEMATPNVYADQIEWFCRHLDRRENAIISVHPHNDRGTAVAATELAVMAGADRVEGTLFGNGERTGNVDLLTLGLNLFTQGVDPGIDFSDMARIVATYEDCTGMTVPPRHPWAGDLVYTAFSGSHQDAIHKGLKAMDKRNSPVWAVPYLPIDPADVGRSYQAVIRVNSQSGKGGVAHVLERDHGFRLPRPLQVAMAKVVQDIADDTGEELSSARIHEVFVETCMSDAGLSYIDHHSLPVPGVPGQRHLTVFAEVDGARQALEGEGGGPIEALVAALDRNLGLKLTVQDYSEHAKEHGAGAEAVAYLQVRTEGGREAFGVAMHRNITAASLIALLRAAARLR